MRFARLVPVILPVVLLAASAVGHAAEKLDARTVRADAAIKQATRVAVRRARSLGLPEVLVQRIDAGGVELAQRARVAHAGNIRSAGGIELKRTPTSVAMRGTVGSYFATLYPHEVQLGGTEWDAGQIGRVREGLRFRFDVQPHQIEERRGNKGWTARRAPRTFTLSGVEVPAGTWLVSSTKGGGPPIHTAAMTDDGRVLAMTDASWRAALE